MKIKNTPIRGFIDSGKDFKAAALDRLIYGIKTPLTMPGIAHIIKLTQHAASLKFSAKGVDLMSVKMLRALTN